MRRGEERPPVFELKFSARASEITFHVAGDVEWRTEGSAHAELVRRREGLPAPVRPHVCYHDVRVATWVKAWLDETGQVATPACRTQSARL
jgi:hypothetical protein